MDGHHFDRLMVALGRGLRRRGVVTVLGGILAAEITETTATRRHAKRKAWQQDQRKDRPKDGGDALADKKSQKNDCAPCKKKRKKDGKCKAKKPNGTACPGGTCLRGKCHATPASSCTPSCEQTICGDDGCGGSCGTCDPAQVCASGQCVLTCPSEHKTCRGNCIPTNHCCTDGECPASGPTCCAGACVNVLADPAHCGGCSTGCGRGHICQAGSCGLECSSDFCRAGSANPDCCGTSCTDTLTDATNCGTCGQVCGTDHTTDVSCQNGTCALTCESGWAHCASSPSTGCETDTANDRLNCGGCGISCVAVGGCKCENSICCQCLVGQAATCSAALPCCSGFTCRTSGLYAGTCCAPSGKVGCFTDDPTFCCGTCVASNPACTGHCPGQCIGS